MAKIEHSVASVLDEKAPPYWSEELPSPTPEALVEAGFHFGHRTSRWNPRMKRYIREKRNGIHVIDLKESLRGIILARHFLRNLCSAGASVVFVGCKRQAKDIIRRESIRARQGYVCERWLGGTLTNFGTIRKRLGRLEELEALEESGEFAKLAKKLQSVYTRERRKIHTNLQGLRELQRLPAALVVVDARAETIAIREANKLQIPVIAIVDTNSDPENIDIVIPGNDDSVRGLQIVLHSLADACIEGRKLKDSGQGMELKLDIRAFDQAPAVKRERGGRRPQRGGGAQRTRHARTAEQKAAVLQSAQEAVTQAEAQKSDSPLPTVRRKPPPAKKPPAPGAEASPVAAPAAESKSAAPAPAPGAEASPVAAPAAESKPAAPAPAPSAEASPVAAPAAESKPAAPAPVAESTPAKATPGAEVPKSE